MMRFAIKLPYFIQRGSSAGDFAKIRHQVQTVLAIDQRETNQSTFKADSKWKLTD
tara:strand:- start:215 stop:379 length:165 start_codon:yes stop_codon:yes gene_type:complete